MQLEDALHIRYARHRPPESVGDVIHAMRDVCESRGLAHLSYFGLDGSAAEDERIALITTCNDRWVDRYFERKYYRVDPVLTIGSKSLLPMNWSSIKVDTEEKRELYEESWGFGVGPRGLSVRVRGNESDTGVVSLSLNCSERTWQRLYDQLTCELLYFAIVLHSQVIGIRTKAPQTKSGVISPREREVLEWAARGKTAWETGKIIGVSERTVSFYIANACEKMGVSSKTHAVAKLISEREISL